MPRPESFNREDMISRAMNVFWEKGYHGASMQDLVDATGLNRSSIYNSFGSKRALYKTTLEHYERESNKNFRQTLLRANCPLGAIRKMLQNAAEFARLDKEGKGCYITNCASEFGYSDKELHHWLKQNQSNTLDLFRELVEQGQQEGVINANRDPKSYALFIYNVFQGLRITGILNKDEKDLEDIIENTIVTMQ